LAFDRFELDLRSGEMRKDGRRIRLQAQPFQLLVLLLKRPGEVVTREEIRRALWQADTFVDFDHSLGSAINKIREALGDSADHPRFVETLPRRGYRFIAEVHSTGPDAPPVDAATPLGSPMPTTRRRNLVWISTACVALVLIVGCYLAWQRHRNTLIHRTGTSRIAVLPFKNLSGSSDQEYFSDGMTDEIITALGKVKSLEVLSRTSVMRYKESGKSLPQIAAELNADQILEGAVLQSGDRVRVTVQLIEARTDHHLWAEEYDRDLRDVLQMQNEVALAVADRVQRQISPEVRQRFANAREVDPEAHRRYMKAMNLCFQETSGSLQKCVEYLQQSLALDPNDAETHAALSAAYDWMVTFGQMPAQEGMPAAKAEALKAIEIDPSLASGHAALGTVLAEYEWDAQGAGKELQRATDLGPSSDIAHHSRGWYLMDLGRWDEAVTEFAKCVELDSLGPMFNAELGLALVRAGRPKEAVHYFQEAEELAPNSADVHRQIGYAYLVQRRYPESIAKYEKVEALSGETERMLGYAYAAGGRKQDALSYLVKLEKLSTKRYVLPYDFAVIYAGLGENERAFKYLEKSYQERGGDLPGLATDVAMDALHADPRFQDLVRRIGFVPGPPPTPNGSISRTGRVG
jgi:TolB-like protein/DNA-binding winged helix-turn-helix (wHTH) protein/Tfp pilus assembly protein PilF